MSSEIERAIELGAKLVEKALPIAIDLARAFQDDDRALQRAVKKVIEEHRDARDARIKTKYGR